MDPNELQTIQRLSEEFLQKMTMTGVVVQAKTPEAEQEKTHEAVELDLEFDEPQILIGQNGQTLFEVERLLRIISNRRLKKSFYVTVDINGYKRKKIEYLKSMARQLAKEVAETKQVKILAPMPAYERRLVHLELAQDGQVVVESQGEGAERHLVIKPRV